MELPVNGFTRAVRAHIKSSIEHSIDSCGCPVNHPMSVFMTRAWSIIRVSLNAPVMRAANGFVGRGIPRDG
jgi:hypothetical protein